MKRTFEETISPLIGAVIISIGIVLITFSARAEDAPASEKKDDSDMKQTRAKQEDPTIQTKGSPLDGEVLVGGAEGTTRKTYEGNSIITTILTEHIELTEHIKTNPDSLIKNAIQDLEPVDGTVATILTGGAEVHRYLLTGEYIGFIKADKIIFIDDKVLGNRLLAIAAGDVKFLRDNIYITSGFAHQDYMKARTTFESKDNVKITDVRISIDKLRDKLNIIRNRDKVRPEVKITRDVDKVYAQASKLSLRLSEQIEKDQDNEVLDTVWTSVFIYDRVTGNQIARGGVKFSLYQLQSLDADAASENAENGTED